MFFDKCASVGTLSKFRIFVIGSLDEVGAPSHSACMFTGKDTKGLRLWSLNHLQKYERQCYRRNWCAPEVQRCSNFGMLDGNESTFAHFVGLSVL